MARTDEEARKQMREQNKVQERINGAVNSAPARNVIRILVAKGVLSIEEAEKAGLVFDA